MVARRGEMLVRMGTGAPGSSCCLLLHGWMATADMNFHPLYPRLAGSVAFAAPDLRGHGRGLLAEGPFTIEDAADDAAALVDDLGWSDVVVVGYSLGGAVAQTMVDRRPDLVRALVIGASALEWTEHALQRWLVPVGGLHGMAQRATVGRWFAHRLVDRARRSNPGVDDLRGWLVAEWERGHPGALRTAGKALARFDGRPFAARCGVPATVVVTTRDRLVRPARQRRLADALGADVVELAAGHDAPVAAPGAFARAMADAIEAHSGRRRATQAG